MSKSSTTTSTNFGSNISSSDLIDAKLEEHQTCGSKHCPGCGHKLEGKPDWLGLPAGVKFDPTDQELMEHLEAKVEAKDIKSHPLIDEFIPTIEGEDGICYTHPEKLPGVTRDGLSRHFFHRPSKAYTTGTRKRRKIQTECDQLEAGGETRWHKTGKTRPVMVNGKQKGCKKILVLYTNFGKNRKPKKTNWVMHQYHLGQLEEEKEGELVVSKIFYQTQPRQCNWSSDRSVTNVADHHHHHHHHGIIIRGEANSRRNSGIGSTPSKEIVPQREEMSAAAAVSVGAAMSGYGSVDIQHLKSHDHLLGFAPFRRSFDEVGIGEASTPRDQDPTISGGTCEEIQDQQHRSVHHHHHNQVTTNDIHQLDQRQQQVVHHNHHTNVHHQIASTTAFHVSRPSNPISTIISPPPLHHASIILDHQADPYHHVSRLMLQNDTFHEQQQHHKLGGRSASGLEELIMSCTSTSSIKEESSITNPQEAEWLKYSPFWPDPDNQDHHG